MRSESLDSLDKNACSDSHQFQQPFGVPVGQSKAAERRGAADFFRVGRTVDAIAGLAETEPRRADGIVRPGWDIEGSTTGEGFG